MWHYEQMVYAKLRIRHRKWDAQNSVGYWKTNGLSNLGYTTWPSDSQGNKKNKKQNKTTTQNKTNENLPKERKETYILLWNWKKSMVYESDGHTICSWHAWYSHQRIGTGSGGLGNERMSRDHLNFSIVEIGYNTKMSPADLLRFAYCQTPAENHQLSREWKNLIIVIIIMIIIIISGKSFQIS